MTYWIKTRDKAEMKALFALLADRGCVPPAMLTAAEYMRRYPAYTILRYNTDANVVNGYHRAQEPLLKGLLKTFAQFKSQLALLNKPFVKSRPAFYMGFELEGCVADEVRDELTAYVSSLYPGEKSSYLVKRDGSIRPKCRGIEIVTPPLVAHRAIEKLEWLLGVLDILSDEGLFETNRSCGFHVNLSESKSFDWPNADARHQFTYQFMKRLDPVKWLRAFGRRRNKYCWWSDMPTDPKDVHLPKQVSAMANTLADREGYPLSTAIDKAKHWAAINTSHLNADNGRRVEVRVAGGKDYHKPERLRDFLLDIRQSMAEAYGSI